MTTQLKEHTQVLEARIQCLIDKLVDSYYQKYPDGYIEYRIDKGTKYYKLVQRDTAVCVRSFIEREKYYKMAPSNAGTSVHAFISRQTGCVYKPASFKAPAKHVRYNLLDDVSFATCIQEADHVGFYLYMR